VDARTVEVLPATCLVLAGGRGSRFGGEKLEARLGDTSLLSHVCRRLGPLFEDTIVVHAPGPDLDLDRPDAVRQVSDLVAGVAGPLVGLAAGLSATATEWAFLTAGDMPFVSSALVRLLFSRTGDEADVVVPLSSRGPEPLCAFYRRSVVGAVASAIERGERRVISFYDAVRVVYVDEPEVRTVDPDLRSFFNVNTTEDLDMARSSLDEPDEFRGP
jgi:molybdopterin-guanine dinucleotide biosynthesis protein A